MAYRVPERIYRTGDGRLVPHGHLEAAFLAFPEGEELSDEEAARLGVRDFVKSSRVPHNKMAAPPLDKQSPVPAEKSSLAELREIAQGHGIKVDGRWSVDRLRQEIEEVGTRPESSEEKS